jgi:hypothetical protein
MDSLKAMAAIPGNVQKADIVLVGEVQSLGEPPVAWSGIAAAYQGVRYRIVRVLKKAGNVKEGDTIEVFHLVVGNSVTAHPERPGLNESLFRPGLQMIVFVQAKNGRLQTFDENYGVLPAEPRTLEAVTSAIRPQAAPAK